jgi:ATP-dependent Clp protease, protease subunit
VKSAPHRTWVAVIAFLAFSLPLTAQQAPGALPPVSPDQISVITLTGEINSASMGQLIAIVNFQVRGGVHKIRLVISSGGGDPSAAFAAYNYLHNLPSVEISTFNIGKVDSAAVILYCAGQQRYTFPATRFLIHGNSAVLAGNTPMDAAAMQGNLAILKNLNEMTAHVISSTVKKEKQGDVENAIHGQVILTPEEAVEWGLAQQVKDNFMEPGAVLVSGNTPQAVPDANPSIKFASTTPMPTTTSDLPKN